MCITTRPTELRSTYIADFPAEQSVENTATSENQPSSRIITYANTVVNPRSGAPAAPNAMLFAVYGDVQQIIQCEDPEASEQWLKSQEAAYTERWNPAPEPFMHDITRSMGTLKGGGRYQITQSGNYIVGIAKGVDDIPAVLEALHEISPDLQEVPTVTEDTLTHMRDYYKAQGYGEPDIVVAGFAPPSGSKKVMHPITVEYTPFASTAGNVILPALDYHGDGPWPEYVDREHHLLVATHGLMKVFSGLQRSQQEQSLPVEFAAAPLQFPISIVDRRKGDDGSAAKAPNSDYVIHTGAIEEALQRAAWLLQPMAADIAGQEGSKYSAYEQPRELGGIVRAYLGNNGLFGYTNQSSGSVDAYRQLGLSYHPTLDMSN